jgi:hypothetical protein
VKIFLCILSSSIHSRWPSQLILCPFIHSTIFSPLLNSSSSGFVLIFHFLSSYFCAFYPPPFSPGDPSNLSLAPLSILLYFLLYSTLLVLDSS